MLRGTLSAIHELEFSFTGFDELVNAWVGRKRPANIRDLPALVLSFWVRHEQDLRDRYLLWRKIV